jgi:hypothetical protein
MHWLARARCPTDRSTTSHPPARSHPRPAFGCRPKGDQLAPGCRLGVEGPKGGEIKEKVEGTKLRQASKCSMITVLNFRLSSHVKEVQSQSCLA